jgi:chemotaxis receptor (MCP) glutamine deamidase CheD
LERGQQAQNWDCGKFGCAADETLVRDVAIGAERKRLKQSRTPGAKGLVGLAFSRAYPFFVTARYQRSHLRALSSETKEKVGRALNPCILVQQLQTKTNTRLTTCSWSYKDNPYPAPVKHLRMHVPIHIQTIQSPSNAI